MSRHRNVRNMRFEDYDDGYYDDDDYEEDDDPGEASQYMWQGSSAATARPPPPAEEDSLLKDLVAQFRIALNDDALTEAEIDRAILDAEYDVDAAMDALIRQREAAAAAAAAEAARLELHRPSAIGEMVQQSDAADAPPAPSLPPPPAAPAHRVTVDSGAALAPPDPSAASLPRFRFDQPSPDDLVRARQSGVGGRKTALRLPKASALRHTPKPAVSVPKPDSGVNGSSAGEKAQKNGAARVHQPPEERPNSTAVALKVVKQRAKKVDLSAKIKAGTSSVSVVVAGHVDAGKSTLLGHLLQQMQEREAVHGSGKSKRRRRRNEDLAWGTDEDGVERERGVTIDIATRVFETQGPKARTYAMIDAPGHRDFVPAMILGATQASAAILVVDASPGEFEAGFCADGQTREHALVLKSLGVNTIVVVVNKMDVTKYDENRYNEVCKSVSDFLKHNGWKVSKNVTFVAVSGREGLNLISKPAQDHPIMQWYDGKTVLEALEGLPSTNASVIKEASARPTRLIVSDFFKSASLGGDGSVTGRLLCGSIAPRDKLMVCPSGTIATVKNLQLGIDERANLVVAGVDSLPVSMGLQDLTDGLLISPGSVLCDPEQPVPVVLKFRAQFITVTTSTPLLQGSRGILHVGGGSEAAAITRLCEYVANKKAKAAQKNRKPRRLVKGDAAIVEITCERPVAMEKAEDVKALGRFALRQSGRTVGVGIVLEILDAKASSRKDDQAE